MAVTARRTGSDDYGRWVKALIAGEPGAGKTLFASTWPDVLYANAEGGLMSVADRNVLTVDVEDSQTLLELIVALRQEPSVREKIFGAPVSTVVIDTLDEVARLLQRERITETKKETLAMADWGWYGDQLRGIIRGFRNLDMHVILNVHLKTSEDADTQSLLVKPNIQGQVGDELAGYVDLALMMKATSTTKMAGDKMVRETARVLQSYANTRFPWIKDRSGKLPAEFDVNFEDDYKRLDQLIFGGRDLDRSPTPTIVDEPLAGVSPVQTEPIAEAETVVPKRTRKPPAAKPQEPTPDPEPTPAPTDGVPTDVEPAPPDPAPEGVDPTTGEMAKSLVDPADDPHPPLPAEAVKEEPAKDAMGLPKEDGPPWVCADCGKQFDDPDQAALSMIRFRRRLDGPCFKNAKTKKR
jgi:AAA domain